jgi:hypothetical protein
MSPHFIAVVISMSVQVVPSAILQRIVVKFLTNAKVKSAEILKGLRAQFNDETLSRTQAYDGVSHLKEAEKSLKTCEDYTFLREGKLWPLIFGLSMCLIH